LLGLGLGQHNCLLGLGLGQHNCLLGLGQHNYLELENILRILIINEKENTNEFRE
jgi:hypothetical protein